MFQDSTSGLTNIPSTWRTKAHVRDDECQTHGYKVISRGNQIIRRAENETQTDDYLYVEEDIQLDYRDGEDRRQVARHLRHVTPFLCEQLERNSRSRAFDHYAAYFNIFDRSRAGSKWASLKHTLVQRECAQMGLGITTLSWNCSGTVVAVAYGDHRHEDWCMHAACVALWNVSKQTVNPHEPDYSFDTQSCVLSLQFHPTLPSLLAAGCFNGDIILWDLSSTGGDFTVAQSNTVSMQASGDLASTGTSLINLCHTEPVVHISWIFSGTATAQQKQQAVASRRQRYAQKLVTVGMDGKVLVWKLGPAPTKIISGVRGGQDQEGGNLGSLPEVVQVVYGYEIRASDLPRSLRVRGKRDQALNLTCALLSPLDPEVLLVACDVGVIFHCSLREAHSGKPFDPNLPLNSPVIFSLTPGGDGAQGQGCSIHSMAWLRPSPNHPAALKAKEGANRGLLLLCAGAHGVMQCVDPSHCSDTQVLFTVEQPSSSVSGLTSASSYIYAVWSCEEQGIYGMGGEPGNIWFWHSKPNIFHIPSKPSGDTAAPATKPDSATAPTAEDNGKQENRTEDTVEVAGEAHADLDSMFPCLSMDWRGQVHQSDQDNADAQPFMEDPHLGDNKTVPSVWCAQGNRQKLLNFAVGYSNGQVQVWDMGQISSL